MRNQKQRVKKIKNVKNYVTIVAFLARSLCYVVWRDLEVISLIQLKFGKAKKIHHRVF